MEFAVWADANAVVFSRLSCDVTAGEGNVCFVLNGPDVTAYIPAATGGWELYGAAATPAPATTAAAPAATGTEDQFKVAFAVEGSAEFENAITYSGLATDAIGVFDLGTASTNAQLAADSYSALYDIAVAAPGAETPLGVAVTDAMSSCSVAWESIADAIDSYDVDAVDAAGLLLGECSDQTGAAADLLEYRPPTGSMAADCRSV